METSGDQRSFPDLDDYDLVLMTSCDIHGVARGRFIFRSSVPGMVKNGIGMPLAAVFSGVRCDMPTVLTEYHESGWSNGAIVPDLSTLRPMTWLSNKGRKVGHVLCDIINESGGREESSSRELAIRQIAALGVLGYKMETSAQVEVTVYQTGSSVTLSTDEDLSKLCPKLETSLSEFGLQGVSVRREEDPGQLVVSTGVQSGISGADQVHRLRVVLRSLLAREGCDVTWMTRPLAELSGNSIRYTMRLTASDGRNAFVDQNAPDKLAQEAHYWLAGLLKNQATVTSLLRPTLNCYSSQETDSNIQSSWTRDEGNRTSRLLVQVEGADVSITDRLPSSASNPYIVLGALVASGLDGLTNCLELPVEGSNGSVNPQLKEPSNLSEALQNLDKDTHFKDRIGPKFSKRFYLLKQEYEANDENKRSEQEDLFQYDRTFYIQAL